MGCIDCNEKEMEYNFIEIIGKVIKHITPDTAKYETLVNDPMGQASKPEYLDPVFLELKKYQPTGIFLDLGSGVGNVLRKAEQYFPEMKMVGIEQHEAYAIESDKETFTIYIDSFWLRQDVINSATVIYAYEPVLPQYMDALVARMEMSTSCKYIILNTCGDWDYKGSMLTLYDQPELDKSVNVPQNLRIYKTKN
jgi:hypothetical protein